VTKNVVDYETIKNKDRSNSSDKQVHRDRGIIQSILLAYGLTTLK